MGLLRFTLHLRRQAGKLMGEYLPILRAELFPGFLFRKLLYRSSLGSHDEIIEVDRRDSNMKQVL